MIGLEICIVNSEPWERESTGAYSAVIRPASPSPIIITSEFSNSFDIKQWYLETCC